MVEIVDNTNPVYLEVTGTMYNVMTQGPDNFGNFKVDMVIEDPDEVAKVQGWSEQYGLKVKNGFKYMTSEGLQEISGPTTLTLRAKAVDRDGNPAEFLPTVDGDGKAVKDLITHGAKGTARFKIYSYKGGVNDAGFKYSAGNGFQLEKVKLQEYTPYGTSKTGTAG